MNNPKVKTRKIIQFQALRFEGVAANGQDASQETEIIALCDDGTLWSRLSTIGGEWCPVEGIQLEEKIK